MAVSLRLAPMLYFVVYPWKSLRTWQLTSCTSMTSICWRLSNASSIVILVGDVMPFMFKVAVLIEAIRSNCGGECVWGRRWFPYFVLIRLRCSRCNPRPFPSYSSAFFLQCYLFISGWCLSRIILFWVFIRRVGCVVRGHCVLVVQPVCTSDVVTISCLVHSSPCVFPCRGRAVCLVGLSSNAVTSASTVITSWGSVQVVKSIGFASSSWGVRSWWVGSCCSPPISSGAFVGFRSSTVGEIPDAWSCDALWGTTSIRLSTVPCRLWAPLAATWAHVLGVKSDVTIPLPRLLGHAWFICPLSPHPEHVTGWPS